jgi:hypothetical protein
LAAILIFLGVYVVLAIGGLPGFRVDRTGACIIGASLMIAFGVLDFEQAYAAINYDTIILLFGMMIVVANLRLSGFFGLVAEWVVEHAHGRSCCWPPSCSSPGCLRLLRQRHHVPGADAAGAGDHAAVAPHPVPYLWGWRWPPTSGAWPPSPGTRRT